MQKKKMMTTPVSDDVLLQDKFALSQMLWMIYKK
jgi:hypothetical protein